jgi:6-pyruvoyltetrahydropterin/6-carboxytetrahydropterin synthase
MGFGKCDRLHGHNYVVRVQLQYLNQTSTESIDFRVVNERIRELLLQLDQKILIPKESSVIQITSVSNGKNWQVMVNEKMYSFPKQDVVILEGINMTTAENLAWYIHSRLILVLKHQFRGNISKITVKVEENLGNEASYSVDDTEEDLREGISPNVSQSE